MGSRHLEHILARDDISLAGVVDTDPARLRRLAGNCPTATDLATALGWEADAAVVAVPTGHHRETVHRALGAGLHTLVEKPIADTVEDAAAMVADAADRGLALMVGHVERHNLMVRTLLESLDDRTPRFVSTVRVAPHPGRSIADGVILDSCIHDLDVVALLLGDDLTLADVQGSLGADGTPDSARLTLTAAGGAVAHLFASWRTGRRHRSLAVLCDDSVYLGDYVAESLQVVAEGREEGLGLVPADPGARDALDRQLDAFLALAQGDGRRPESLAGLALALEATRRLSP